MSMPRFRPLTWLAWAVVVVAFVLPVVQMFVRSFQAVDVITTSGETYRAVGEVQVGDEEVTFSLQPAPGMEKQPWSLDVEEVAEVRTVYSLDHYRRVFTDSRTVGLVRNSVWIAFGGALLGLLLGLPIAFLVGRTDLWGRRLMAALCLGPAILPPFFIALGGARRMQEFLIGAFEVSGGTLQMLNAMLVFGCVLFPLTVLLVAPALAAVPAGPYESARMLRGRRAAFRHVVVPAVLPSVLGSFVLSFLIALTDFAVPDVLGFMLPAGGAPSHVFATEILLQWKQEGNTGRAVATGAPFLLITFALLGLALWFLRGSPLLAAGRPGRLRPRVRMHAWQRALAYLFVLAVLGVALLMPLLGIASWAGAGGESATGGSASPAAVVSADGAALFDFTETLDRTRGSREERDRWLWTGLAAALLAIALAIPLARLATRGGRIVRTFVLVVGALPLAVPGLVLGVGTLLFWQAIPGDWVLDLEEGILRSTLVLAARFLPFALLAAWLALRAIRPGHEESAAMLGASASTRGVRLLAPLAWPGVFAGGLVVLVLALRELDAVILIDPRILPMRLYDKIHFNRMADEANLLFLCLAYLLVPAVLAALFLALRGRRRRP